MKKTLLTLFATVLVSGLLTGCNSWNRQDTGMVVGGVAGGVAGSALTGGSTAGTVVGAVGGGLIGRQVAQ